VIPLDLLPLRSAFAPGDDVVVEARHLDESGAVTVWHLGDEVGAVAVTPDDAAAISLGPLPAGGYGVELTTAAGTCRTAVQVLADPRSRMRYGFVADYSPGRDPAPVVDLARRLHLTDVQFYDWAYRHADLVGGGDAYDDALGQRVALDTVRSLVVALQAAGTRALGYAAVYGVGRAEWQAWEHAALVRSSGEPYTLGELLWLVDPAAPDWSAHLVGDLAAAVDAVGFDGFHLDQYGYPRVATRRDGTVVDVAASFATIIDAARRRLPGARLVFNNVNDFPTPVTARTQQDAVYVEVWPPHTTLAALARVVTRARAAGAGKPVVIAAYQSVYTTAPVAAADLSTALTMATLYSHGATQLLAGESDRLLVDPYYVRNHVAEPTTAAMLRRWYDFLVEHDELLVDPGIVDVTGAWVGAYNDAIDVTAQHADVSDEPVAGAIWRRVTQAGNYLVMHLINLIGQHDTAWDEPRREPGGAGAVTLRVRRAGSAVPRVRTVDPDRGGRLEGVAVHIDGEHAVATLPAPYVWQMVTIELVPA
jgi:dextranase